MKSTSNHRNSRSHLGSLFLASAMFIQGPIPGGTLAVALTGGAVSFFSTSTAEARPRSVRGAGTARRTTARRTTARRSTARRVTRRTTRRVVALGVGATLVYLGSRPYYYWGGDYYEKEGDTYIQVIVE